MALLRECSACHYKLSDKMQKAGKCRCGLPVRRFTSERYWYRIWSKTAGRYMVGSFGWCSLDVAKKLYRKKRVEIGDMDYMEDPSKVLTLHDLFERFLQLPEFTTKGEITRIGLIGAIKRVLHTFKPNMMISDFTIGRFEGFVLNELERYAPGSVRQRVVKLKRIFNVAVRHEWIRVNPIAMFRFPKKVESRSRVVTQEEFKRLLAATVERPLYHDVILVGYYTGMRLQEVTGLRWDEVDLEKRVIRLSAQRTKAQKSRVIPLHDDVINVLNQRRGQDPVFESPSGREVKKWKIHFTTWRSICDRAGVEGIVFHDLRRGATVNMAKAGTPERLRKAVLGHSSSEVHAIYDRVQEDDLVDVKWLEG